MQRIIKEQKNAGHEPERWRLVRWEWLVIAACAMIGCAKNQHLNHGNDSHSTAANGEAAAPPDMETLPSPDVRLEQMSEKMRFAWLLTEQSFELEQPAPPLAESVADLQEWSRTSLQTWLTKKNQMVEAARAELDVAAEESHRQRIMAGALVGLMYEDVARVLLKVPTPRELDSEPEVAEAYRYVVDFQASPYLRFARRAYMACAANGRRPKSMKHWSQYCSTRAQNLPLRLNSGETVVTVIEEQ